MLRGQAVLAVTAAAFVTLMALAAKAEIVCDGNYQLVNGSMITTPYCRDTNLARLARANGFTVTNEAILYNPNKKRDICRYMSSNINVMLACLEVQGPRGSEY